MAPWGDAVDGDPAWTQLFRQVAGKNLNSPLHGRIGGAPRKDDAGRARRDRHNSPAVVNKRKELLRQEEHALEVDSVEAVQLFLCHLVECSVVRDAGIVDKIVEALSA
jgi:hypothetical protein